MQGYIKNEEQRAFEKKVKKLFMIHHVFYSQNYGEEVNEFSKPDFFICMHGLFLAVEIDFYTPNENGEKPKLSQKVIDSINQNKGAVMIVSPDTFEQFEKEFIKTIIIMQKEKSFMDKMIAGLKKKEEKKIAKEKKEAELQAKPQTQPKRQFTVEVKKKPLFQKKSDAFYQERYSQSLERKSRF